MDCELAVKIDVDTLKGYLEGVPCLLNTLGERNIKASIFFSMGPDASGRAIRRIFRRGFLAKMLRTRAPATYGLKTLLYGTLLRAPMIVSSNPDILKRALEEGHDCGIHGWNHVRWQDRLTAMSREEIRVEFTKAVELFSRLAGRAPSGSAAPGWQISTDSLFVQDELGFAYCSDVRGKFPFLPRMSGVTFRTLQIPSTLPTTDELWGLGGMDADAVKERCLDLLEPGLNVHTVHAEMEGGVLRDSFRCFLDCCIEGEVGFVTLQDVALRQRGRTGVCDVDMKPITGRAGEVATQMTQGEAFRAHAS
ncbi:MAG: polysaccharide deacetylase family protein [Synergistaceae bacterium]|jgi:peptidoglycan/xylan/chitin deacetylase (PgdA/CDA1 family)|nr:polysaccharide deacetylase family protein [Synergistaceae bacterium]